MTSLLPSRLTQTTGTDTATGAAVHDEPSRARPAVVEVTHLAERAGWSAVCAVLLTLGITAWSNELSFPGAGIAQMTIVVVAIGAAWRCWRAPGGPSRRVQVLVLAAATLSIAVTTLAQVTVAPYYGTDSVAFGQYSAHLALAGLNPFTHSMAPSLRAYHVPVIFTTHYLNGSRMLSASYPAGSFLFYLPALALGWSTQAAIGVDVIFWAAAMILMWALLPRAVSWVAALLLASSVYATYTIGGVTDCLYIPFLVVALWRWDRFGDNAERSWARWAGPLALGVAMSVKQTPWFALPFLLLGVAFEAHHAGRNWLKTCLRYLGGAAATFLAINAVWIVADPKAWYEGSVAPLTASFVPLGQGLINLTLVNRVGGGDLSFYTYAGAAWLVASLTYMALRYRQAKRIWMFLVIASFFFTPRSLGNYFLMLLPGALVAAITVRDALDDAPLLRLGFVRRLSPVALIVPLAAVAISVGGAAAAAPPLSVKILSVATNGQQELVTDATVRIVNHTGRVLHPTFTLNNTGYITNFWTPATDPRSRVTIGAHRSEVVTLQAPDVASMPSTHAPFQLFSYTTGPDAVSTSQTYTASTDTLYLTPSSLDAPIPVGRKTVLAAQLDDRYGRPVRRSGVHVDLGQVIYAEDGLLGGVASINGAPEGSSPVTAVTDSAGVATFTIVGDQPSEIPDYFQAWVSSPASRKPPSGYSQVVAARFMSAARS